MTKKNTELAPTAPTELAIQEEIPSWIPQGAAVGTEHMTKEDANIPRLAIAQGTSHQMKPQDALYIDDLKLGDIFNDLTGQIYGQGPVPIVVVRADPPRYIEFSDDRSIVDPNVPADDPRTQFTTDPETQQRIPPIATKFYDYVILVGDQMEPVAFSCSKTAIKHTAKRLNGLLRSKPIPIYACRYTINSEMLQNDEGSWYVLSVKQAGFLDEVSYKKAEAFFTTFREKPVEFERQPGEDNPNEM